MADWADLDGIFSLPEHIGEPWRALYEILVARTRAETAHLPLQTSVQLIIERYVSGYIQVRWCESHPIGQPNGFASPSQMKDMNAWWLGLAKELNEMLFRSKAADREAVVNEIVGSVKESLVEVLRLVPDRELRDTLRGELVASLSARGL